MVGQAAGSCASLLTIFVFFSGQQLLDSFLCTVELTVPANHQFSRVWWKRRREGAYKTQ